MEKSVPKIVAVNGSDKSEDCNPSKAVEDGGGLPLMQVSLTKLKVVRGALVSTVYVRIQGHR